MIRSVLVVCVGNICRSPVSERLLKQKSPSLLVESCGLASLAGSGIDAQAAEIAHANGIRTQGHIARTFSVTVASKFDLILAMEKGHLAEISQKAPQLSGKSLLLGQWLEGKEIPDPYQRDYAMHAAVFNQMNDARERWAEKLARSA